MMQYEEIIDGLTNEKVIQLMQSLGVTKYVDKGNYIQFPTICHNESEEEASMKLYWYGNNKIFYCYTECGSMSIFKFLKQFYELRHIEYDWYKDIYQVILDAAAVPKEGFKMPTYKSLKDRFEVIKKEIELPEFSSNALDCFVKQYPQEWLDEGISKSAMDKFDIRYSISQNKIIIPHLDANGRLVGIRGRALDEWEIENVGKYMPVKIEGVWYSHPLSLNLYGLYENKSSIKEKGICFVFEGEKSVLKMEEAFEENCAVAACGSNFNKYSFNLLMKLCSPREVVLCFDKEEHPGSTDYFNKLYSIGEKYKNYCNFSFIYDRLGLLDMKDSPIDKGIEVFKKLLEKRVQVR